MTFVRNKVTQGVQTKFSAQYIYDIECYPNFFSIVVERDTDESVWVFEISEWVDQSKELNTFLWQIAHSHGRMVGFNNLGYDYPMLHFIMLNHGHVNYTMLYQKSQAIFADQKVDQYAHTIWDRDRLVPQLDLYKIHHFDNAAKRTSLKLLEFNMRLDEIEELPYDPLFPLTWEQSRHLLRYNHRDKNATRMFYEESKGDIALRDDLSVEFGKDFTNFNDSKIGSEFFSIKLKEAGVNVGKHNQSPRSQIVVNDIILPYIRFERPEFQRVLDIFRNMVVTETKGAIDGLSAVIDGFSYDFGTGGIHGSVSPQVFHSDDDYVIMDIDYTSFYPKLSITNGFYPEHLSPVFCEVYESLFLKRAEFPKGHSFNKVYKLALNGTYGNSNNEYSPFYDPKFTMSITINGQLTLCMLSELLMKIPEFQMIFVNTDGLCCRIPRQYEQYLYDLCEYSDKHTGLTLEFQKYKMLAIRDVNNYIGVTYD